MAVAVKAFLDGQNRQDETGDAAESDVPGEVRETESSAEGVER
jgi:hypothetical protein